MQESLRDEKCDPDKIVQHIKDLAQELHNNVSNTEKIVQHIKNLQRCKFPQNSLALMVLNFHLDAKNEEKVKKVLKISLALPENLLANVSGQVEFYTPGPCSRTA